MEGHRLFQLHSTILMVLRPATALKKVVVHCSFFLEIEFKVSSFRWRTYQMVYIFQKDFWVSSILPKKRTKTVRPEVS